MTIEIGKILSGFENEFGVTLHRIQSQSEDEVTLEVVCFSPESDEYEWAKQELDNLELP